MKEQLEEYFTGIFLEKLASQYLANIIIGMKNNS